MFQYEKKLENGTNVSLTMVDMSDIKQYYEAACTAEYLLETGKAENEEEALKLGYEIRRQMDKYGYDEEEAIKEVIGG